MKSLSFRKDLIGVQEELLRFAYKLTGWGAYVAVPMAVHYWAAKNKCMVCLSMIKTFLF